MYTDLSKAASEGGDKVSDNVVNVIQEGVSKIQQLSSTLSAGALAPLLANHPALKSALGDSYNQLTDLGNKYGPEARKITEDAVKQIKDLTDKGVNGESIAKAVSIAKQKLEEVRKLGQQVGSEAYSKAAEGARPYLDKAPDVKKYLEESVDGLKEYVGDDGVKLINETYSELEAAGKKGDSASDSAQICSRRRQGLTLAILFSGSSRQAHADRKEQDRSAAEARTGQGRRCGQEGVREGQPDSRR